MDHSIRIATASDADRIAEIYNHYVVNTVVTFEEEPVEGDEMRRRMDEVVAERDLHDRAWALGDGDEPRRIVTLQLM